MVSRPQSVYATIAAWSPRTSRRSTPQRHGARRAPDGDDRRNANQLAALPCRVRLMPVTGSDLRRAARQYGTLLPERLDVVHLGIGDDGDTASWPPGDGGPVESVRPVEVVPEFHGVPRMTLTRQVVNDARSRVVLTVGASKRETVERWLLRDPALPILSLIHISEPTRRT